MHDWRHVFWICGRAFNQGLQRHERPGPGSVAACAAGELRQPLPGGVESWHPGFLDKDNPALGPLTEPASLYQSVLVYKHFPMTWSPQTTAAALIKLDDGQPLLAERTVGTGSVLLLGTGVHVDWTNLPLKPLFLPLLARLTLHLAGAENERTMGMAGVPVTLPLGRGKVQDQPGEPEVEVVRPSGEVVRIRMADQNADGWRYADTHEAGVYLVRQVNRKPPKLTAFAINIDPAESDPSTVTQADLQARFGTRPLLFCAIPASCPEPSSASVRASLCGSGSCRPS